MEKRKQQILILVVLGLVLLGVAVPVAYFIVRSREKVATMQSALEAYNKKDYDTAIERFSRVLARDEDNEMAVTKLAEIYGEKGNWPQSAYYWQQACRLNNLNADYEKNFVQMALRGRLFDRVATFYMDSRHKKLSLDEQLVLDFCLLMSNDPKNGIDLWKKILKENPKAVEMPYGRLIKVTHFAAEQTFEWVFAELDALIASGDVNIAQEALITLANVNRMVQRQDEEEVALKKLAELNFYVGMPMLGLFYSNHFKYVEAIDVFEKYNEKYASSHIALIWGELLLFTSQQEKLEKLAADWKKKGGKANLRAAYYLASLQALARQDLDALATAYQPIRGEVNTPLAAFLSCLVDVQLNDTHRLEDDLLRFQKVPPFMDLRQRVHALGVLYLQDRINAGVSPKELLRVTDILLNAKFSDDPDATPMLVNLVGRLQSHSLTEEKLDAGLLKLPDDPTCMEVAIKFHYFRGNMAEAKKYLDQLEKINDGKLSVGLQQLAINIVSAQGDVDGAAKRFFALLQEDKSLDTFITCFLFCFDTKRKDDVQKLAEKAASDEALADARPFCQAGLQLLDGATDKGLDQLESSDTSVNSLLYFAGRELAANGRPAPAIAKLSKITPEYSRYMQTLSLLAMLHLDTKDIEKAKAFATQALAIAPNTASPMRVLAICARLEDNWQTALDWAKPTIWESNGDGTLRDIWIWAMEKNIASEFDAQRYPAAKTLCERLVKVDKTNAVGAEYLAKLKDLAEQKKAEAK